MSSALSTILPISTRKIDPLAIAVPNFSIRNLTAESLNVVLLERFTVPSDDGSFFNITKNLTALAFNSTAPSTPKVAENAEPLDRSKIENVTVAPFTIHKTDLKPPIREGREVVRLTFEVNGERYRMDCPPPTHSSHTLHALQTPSKRTLTGIFLQRDSFVCIFSSSDLDCWMKHLHDASPLSVLSIPGTHNSPTCHSALPSVRCQAVSPRHQLQNGVRFFDVRVQAESRDSPKLVLVHGVFSVSLTGTKYFHDLEKVLVMFLEAHPSECIILSLKREGTGNATDAQLAKKLFDNYTGPGAANASYWYTDPSIPTLGKARGKIVLLRRFKLGEAQRKLHGGRGFGIDASIWADNTPFDMQTSVCVQDFYEVLESVNIEKKIRFASEQLERAGDVVAALPGSAPSARSTPQSFYLNFLSGSNFWRMNCWPDRIAAKVNPAMLAQLCMRHHVNRTGTGETAGDGSTGIVICDYAGLDGDWDLVRCIVACNTRLRAREIEIHMKLV